MKFVRTYILYIDFPTGIRKDCRVDFDLVFLHNIEFNFCIKLCIPLLILRSLGLVELFENVRALSENRSNKMYLFSFQNIENRPPT